MMKTGSIGKIVLALAVICGLALSGRAADVQAQTVPQDRVQSLYINWYVYPRNQLGVDYYIDVAKRAGFNRLMLPVCSPYPKDRVPEQMHEYFIEQCHKHGIQAIAWYFTKTVTEPDKFLKEILTKYKFDGVSADDGYEMVVGGKVKTPADMDKCMAYAKKVHRAVKGVNPKLSVATSGSQLPEACPVGIRCIKEGLLDFIEPEVYHRAKDDKADRSGYAKVWLEAVGKENAGKIVILLVNDIMDAKPKLANDLLKEVKEILGVSPKIGVGLFASYWLTDDQIEIMRTREPYTGKLPEAYKRTKDKINVLMDGYQRGVSPNDYLAFTSEWIDMLTAEGATVKLGAMPVLTDELLDNCDIYVGCSGYHSWSKKEVATLGRFVDRGGRIIEFGGNMYEMSGSILSQFGLTVSLLNGKGSDPVCKTIAQHPLTEGVSAMQGSARGTKNRWCAQITAKPPAQVLMAGKAEDTEVVGLAVYEDKTKGGRVVLLGVGPNVFFNEADGWPKGTGLDSHDHLRLARNMVKWICEGKQPQKAK
ncbi:MAG: hypothetical protein L6455_00060 [Kiritimatiellae bacterium]|nr:hypothetical protein [Verrucomicrobiota bacterium]MCG2678355.1 hypothetical protein [Kiritimatiellia bacterium]